MLHRTHTGIQIELLPHCDIERTDPTAYRSCQRSFDRDTQVFRCSQGIFRHPVAELRECLFTSKNLIPGYPTLAPVGLFHCGIKNTTRSLPNVTAGAIALDEGNNGIVRNAILAAFVTDRRALGWDRHAVIHNCHE